MTPNTAEDGITALTYEAALAELDTLITKLEGGSIALEEAIGAYERGVVLAQHCAELLARTERRVSQLVVSASGAIGERPLEAESGPSSEHRGATVSANPVRTALPRIDPDDVPF
jgi:exodeoxyribonuclease VII small subunit